MQVTTYEPERRPRGRGAGGWLWLVGPGLLVLASLSLAIAEDPALLRIVFGILFLPFALTYLFSRPAIVASAALASHAWGVELAGPWVTPFKITGAIALVITVRELIRTRVIRPVPRLYVLGLLALFVLAAAGEFMAEYEITNSPFYDFAGTGVVLFLTSQTFYRPDDARTVARVFMFTLLGSVLSVWMQVGWALLGDVGTRATGLCGQANVLGNHIAISVPFALAVAFDREERVMLRLVGLLTSLGAVYGEWAAASRGGSIGFVTAIVVFAIAAPRSSGRRILALIVAVLVLGGMGVAAPKSFERVTDTIEKSEGSIDDLTSERTLHARIAADMIPRHPWFGHGMTAFGYERARLSGTLGGALHSAVLAVAVAYGLPAVFLYVLLQASAIVVILRSGKSDKLRIHLAALAAAAGAGLTSGLSGTDLFRVGQFGLVGVCHIIAFYRGRDVQAAAGKA